MGESSWEPESSMQQPVQASAGFDLFGMLLRRKWIVAFCAIVGMVCGYFSFSKQPIVYQSTSRLMLIQETPAFDIEGLDPQQVQRQNIATQVELIKSPVVINASIESDQLEKIGAARLRRNLVVAPSTKSGEILELSYIGSTPEECQMALFAVMESYQKFLRDTHTNVGKEALQLINNAQKDLWQALQDKRAEYDEFRRDSQLIWTEAEGRNPHRDRLRAIEETRSEIQLRNTEIRAQIAAINSAKERGVNEYALLTMLDQYSRISSKEEANADPDQMRDAVNEGKLFPLLLEEQLLLEEVGPDHPKVIALRKRIEVTQAFMNKQASLLPDGNAKELNLVDLYVESLEEELKANDEKLDRFDALFATESELARAMTTEEIRNAALIGDIERLQRLYDAATSRLEEIDLTKDVGSTTAQMISPPGRGTPLLASLPRYLGTGALMGAFVGLVFGYIVELADKTFRTPQEIRAQLQMPVIGHIPAFDEDKLRASEALPNLSPTIRTAHSPKSRMAESYRAVRTALYFSTRGHGHQIIQVTSPDPGDGKSTLATNLAVSIAQSGKKCLILDGDFRRPRIRKLFGLDPTIGCSQVMSGELELPDAVQSTGIDNLWALPVGPRIENPSEMLSSSRFDDLLAILREKYEFVIIDTPPLLAVTDPCPVAARVDGVILNVRLSRKLKPKALRAKELLDQVSANVLGVVVNGVGNATGYGYGDKHYNYQSEHYSSYGRNAYTYGSRKNGYHKYYEDDVDHVKAIPRNGTTSTVRDKQELL